MAYNLNFEKDSGEKSVFYTLNCNGIVSGKSKEDWITVSVDNADGKISVLVQSNNSGKERSGTIILYVNGKTCEDDDSKKINVTQAAGGSGGECSDYDIRQDKNSLTWGAYEGDEYKQVIFSDQKGCIDDQQSVSIEWEDEQQTDFETNGDVEILGNNEYKISVKPSSNSVTEQKHATVGLGYKFRGDSLKHIKWVQLTQNAGGGGSCTDNECSVDTSTSSIWDGVSEPREFTLNCQDGCSFSITNVICKNDFFSVLHNSGSNSFNLTPKDTSHGYNDVCKVFYKINDIVKEPIEVDLYYIAPVLTCVESDAYVEGGDNLSWDEGEFDWKYVNLTAKNGTCPILIEGVYLENTTTSYLSDDGQEPNICNYCSFECNTNNYNLTNSYYPMISFRPVDEKTYYGKAVITYHIDSNDGSQTRGESKDITINLSKIGKLSEEDYYYCTDCPCSGKLTLSEDSFTWDTNEFDKPWLDSRNIGTFEHKKVLYIYDEEHCAYFENWNGSTNISFSLTRLNGHLESPTWYDARNEYQAVLDSWDETNKRHVIFLKKITPFADEVDMRLEYVKRNEKGEPTSDPGYIFITLHSVAANNPCQYEDENEPKACSVESECTGSECTEVEKFTWGINEWGGTGGESDEAYKYFYLQNNSACTTAYYDFVGSYNSWNVFCFSATSEVSPSTSACTSFAPCKHPCTITNDDYDADNYLDKKPGDVTISTYTVDGTTKYTIYSSSYYDWCDNMLPKESTDIVDSIVVSIGYDWTPGQTGPIYRGLRSCDLAEADENMTCYDTGTDGKTYYFTKAYDLGHTYTGDFTGKREINFENHVEEYIIVSGGTYPGLMKKKERCEICHVREFIHDEYDEINNPDNAHGRFSSPKIELVFDSNPTYVHTNFGDGAVITREMGTKREEYRFKSGKEIRKCYKFGISRWTIDTSGATVFLTFNWQAMKPVEKKIKLVVGTDDGNYFNGVVTKCVYDITEANTYTIFDNEYASAYAAYKVDEGDIIRDIIPSTYEFREQSDTGHTIMFELTDRTELGGFKECSKLTSIVIPNSVTSIGNSAFFGCTGLTSITSNAKTAPTIQNDTFQNINTSGTLYVPIGSSGYNVWMDYLGTGWNKVEV